MLTGGSSGSKQELSFPTVSTEALMVTSVINLLQAKCVEIVDINAFFLKTDLPLGEGEIRFEGVMADALVK